MPIIMMMSSPDTDPEDLQGLVIELMRTINRETDAAAGLPREKSEPGTRGDGAALSQIVLTAFTSGAVVALFEVLKTYFQRKPSLEIDFQKPDGTRFKVKTEHLGPDQIDHTLTLAQTFTREQP